MRQLSLFIRPAQDEFAHVGFLECFSWVQRCITGCVDNLAAYFTPYAFTYVGLYGYGLLEGGHNATDLFKKRGWLPIVSDDLVPNVLLMVSLVIGGVTGCFAVGIQQLDRLDISTLHSPTTVAFGYVLSYSISFRNARFRPLANVACFSCSLSTALASLQDWS